MNPSFLPGLVAFPAGPLTARSPSALVLIATNLVPVFGVFFAGWDVGSIMAIYWLENVAIGFLNIVKMLLARGDRAILPARIALAAFFAVHYGIFTLVHGVFVFLIFQKDGIFGGGGGGPMAHAATAPFAAMGGAIQAYGLAFLALFGSHLFSLFANYLGRGEYREKGVQAVMMQPYGRIVVLHLTIILGAFVTMALGSPKPVILLLVFLKTYADVFFHLKEHNKGTAGSLAGT